MCDSRDRQFNNIVDILHTGGSTHSLGTSSQLQVVYRTASCCAELLPLGVPETDDSSNSDSPL